MLGIDGLALGVLIVAGGICVISMLGVFASVAKHETELHDLRNRVASLSHRYSLQLAKLHGALPPEISDAEPEFDIIDDDGEILDLESETAADDSIEEGEAVPAAA